MLRSEFGMEGYGAFWAILESIAMASDSQIHRVAIGGLSLGYGMAKEKLEEIVDFCISIELLKEENGCIFSPRMQQHKAVRLSFQEAGRRGAKKRWSTSQKNSHPNGKGKGQGKGKENNYVVPKSLQRWLKQNGKGKGYEHWLIEECGDTIEIAWKKVLAGRSVNSPADFVDLCKTLSSC